MYYKDWKDKCLKQHKHNFLLLATNLFSEPCNTEKSFMVKGKAIIPYYIVPSPPGCSQYHCSKSYINTKVSVRIKVLVLKCIDLFVVELHESHNSLLATLKMRIGYKRVTNWQAKMKFLNLYSGTPTNTYCGPTDRFAIL